MPDAIPPRPPGRAPLYASAALFGLFLVQVSYQVYHIQRLQVRVDADLSAELAEATFLDDEPAPASAGWPQWRGPHRDGSVAAESLRSDWPEDGPPQMWHKPIGLGYSSFAVKDGRLFSLFQEGGREVVACWRVADGEEVWRHAYDCRATIKDYPGPRSTPTLDGDRVYTVGSAGKLLCLSADTGSPYWEKDLLAEFHAKAPQWGVAFSPLVDGDLLYTNPGGRDGNSLAAFNKKTGELVWKALDDPPGYSSPVAATIGGTRQILFFLGNALVGVTADEGKLCWRYPWETTYDVNAATPLIFRAQKGGETLHYVFISSGYGRGCALLKIQPTPAGGFEAKRVWEGKQVCSHFASPVRRGDCLFAIDDSRLVCVDLRTGKVLWKRLGINKGSLLRAGDYLLVLAENGRLFVFEASAEGQKVLAEASPLRGRCWTMPVLADGKLFLRDEEQMKCLDLRKGAR